MENKTTDSSLKQMFAEMAKATETPSETCPNGPAHNFEFAMHSDGRDSYSNYFRCTNCREMVVRRQKRTGLDKLLWESE